MRLIFFFLIFILCSCGGSKPVLPEAQASPEALEKHLKVIVEEKADPHAFRNFLNLEELNRVAAYVKKQFQDMGYACEYQTYVLEFISEQREYRNVMCTLPGQSTELEHLVIGAHYDVHGAQDGADDNGSGVVGLLELGRLLVKHQEKIPYAIELVAYTLEEPPYFGTEDMGSYRHAELLQQRVKQDNLKVRGMISLEMIGFFTEKETQEYPAGVLRPFYPEQGNYIAAVSNFGSGWMTRKTCRAMEKIPFACERLMAPSILPGVDFSDHRNYWAFGFDAIMITDTAFFRNKNYHEVTDTMATLDFVKMGQVVDGVYRLIMTEL